MPLSPTTGPLGGTQDCTAEETTAGKDRLVISRGSRSSLPRAFRLGHFQSKPCANVWLYAFCLRGFGEFSERQIPFEEKPWTKTEPSSAFRNRSNHVHLITPYYPLFHPPQASIIPKVISKILQPASISTAQWRGLASPRRMEPP